MYELGLEKLEGRDRYVAECSSLPMSEPQEPPSYATWAPPVYDMNSSPRQLYSTHVPQSQAAADGTEDPSVFARLAKW